MFGVVRFPQNKQAGDGTHQVVVHPEAAHCVVRCGINPHRLLVGVIAADALVHRHQVAVAGGNGVFAFSSDGIGEVEVNRASPWADAPPRVAEFSGPPGGDVPRRHVAVGGIKPLEEVVAFLFRYRIGLACLAGVLGQPDPPVVAQAFAHQRQLALEDIATGNAGGMDLGEAGIGEQRPFAVGPPDRTGVRLQGIGGEEVDVAVPTAAEQNRAGGVHLQFTAQQMARHHTAGNPIHGDHLENVPAGEQLNAAQLHLAHQGLVGAIKQLLSGLPPGIKGAAHQGPAKTAGGQAAAVFARERHPLGHALIDDAAADFRQPLAARFPGAEVASFEGVGEQAADAVAIHRHRTCGIDAPLGRHRVSAARAVVEAEHRHPVALLGQSRSCGSARQAGAHHEHIHLPFAEGADQRQSFAGPSPGIGDRTSGNPGIRQSVRHANPPRASPRLISRKPPPIPDAKSRPPQRMLEPLAGVSRPRLRCPASLPCSRCRPMARLPAA